MVNLTGSPACTSLSSSDHTEHNAIVIQDFFQRTEGILRFFFFWKNATILMISITKMTILTTKLYELGRRYFWYYFLSIVVMGLGTQHQCYFLLALLYINKAKRTNEKRFWVGYLNEVQLRPRFSKSLDLQIISSILGYSKKICAFPVYALRFH